MTISPGTEIRSKSGIMVRVSERTLMHMGAHPEMLSLVHEVIGKINHTRPDKANPFADKDTGEKGTVLGYEVQMGRTIGTSIGAIVPDHAPKMFARRPGRSYPTHVVLEGEPMPTASVCVWIRWYEDGHYELSTMYAGGFSPREPSDPYFTPERTEAVEAEFQRALTYWSYHALIHEGKPEEAWQSTWENELVLLGIL